MVHCSDCGFLALRNQFTGQLDEAEVLYRKTGKIQNRLRPGQRPEPHVGVDSFEWPYTDAPICFVQAYDLADEFYTLADTPLDVLRAERNCDDRKLFTPWQQGFTPREHRDMRDRQWMMEREDKRDSDARRWRIYEFLAVLAGLVLIIVAAFIERGG
jgi:hypothetical protein